VANLHNPYIHQLVVVLDSISLVENCSHFIQRIQTLSKGVQSEQPDMFVVQNKKDSNIAPVVDLPATLTCLDRVEGQPNYLEMFQYSSMSAVQGPVVAMANADQVFDSSLNIAASLKPNALVVVSTAGYETTRLPKHLTDHYSTIVHRLSKVGPAPISDANNNNNTAKDLCRGILSTFRKGFSFSWDVYIFH
jgi:hypothetical protein